MWTFGGHLVFLSLVGVAYCSSNGLRVVNGSDTTIEKFPFMVSLRGISRTHLCGASIIAPRFILTAAHCTEGRLPSEISIQYSSTKVAIGSPNVVPVRRIIQHEDYDPNSYHINDIALLELYGQFVFNYETLAPVQLPEAFFEIPQEKKGAPGVLAGWGLDMSGGSKQKTLQEVVLKIYSDEECITRHEGVTWIHQICGGVDDGGKGQCSGDSGGPLLLNGKTQVGVVSWSIKPCAVYPFPGVYTKVSHYIDWINKHVH